MSDWLISSDLGVHAGDTTSWFASFGEFCAKYCEKRFAAYCASPRNSPCCSSVPMRMHYSDAGHKQCIIAMV